MGIVCTLALKDLQLVLRDRFGLFWMLVFPLLIALFFGFLSGGGAGPSALPVAVVDEADTAASKALLERLRAKEAPDSGEPLLRIQTLPRAEARERVRKGRLVAYVVIPRGYDALPFDPGGPALEIGYDPRRSAEVGYLQGLLTETAFAGLQDQFGDPKRSRERIDRAVRQVDNARDVPADQKKALKAFLASLGKFMGDFDPKRAQADGPAGGPARPKLEAVTPDGALPLSAFEVTFPSAVLWGILGCVTTFAVSLVLERLEGTFLRLQVAPASWGQLLAGKGLACFLACGGVALVLLVIGWVGFGVRLGNVPLLLLAVACTAACFTGIMMFVSTLGQTPAGVAGSGWGVMMPMAMLGGGMIPLIAMPDWLRTLSSLSPVSWGIYALEGAIWRGFSAAEMLPPCAVLLAVGAVGFAAGAQILSLRETGRAWFPRRAEALAGREN